MVNVPGRSKGCKNCRKRKIKCSEERPECLHCVKSGRKCPGYERERIFVHSDVVTEAEKNRQLIKEKQIKGNITVLEQPKDCLKQRSLEDSSSEQPFSQLPESNSSHALVTKSIRQQMLVSYFAQYYTMLPDQGTGRDGCAWVTACIPSAPSPTKALETAAYALSLARHGTIMNRQDLVQESLKLYTEGLHRIQMALWDPQFMYSDDTLGACMLLAMYEVFQCPSDSRKAYSSHLAGCTQLIQLRGPAAHIDGLAHSVFEWFRFAGTIDSLELMQTSFLNDEDWRTLPFSKFPKTVYQRVLDLLLETPRIQRRAEQLTTVPPEQHIPWVIDLIQACISIDDRMQEIYLKIETCQGGPVYWPDSGLPYQHCNPGDPSAISYSFSSFRTGMTMVLSWATLTVVWSGMCHLYQYLGFLTPLIPTMDGQLIGHYTLDGEIKEFSLLEPSRFQEFPAMAMNVCQSVEYCMQDELGISTLVCTLAMVVETLSRWPDYERELLFAKDMIGQIQRKGMRIAEYTY